ncbi:hypothetical protein ABT301_35575 [Streptomyces sp. NPDC000987]|uniref:hypothetical protein n=1 Tax=Streptomyces sp. NPDC000987 TaxID=3154374 RepID=UPI00332F122C
METESTGVKASFSTILPNTSPAGRLRSGFVLDDLILVLMADRGIHSGTTAGQVKASRRFAGLLIRAFEACPRRARPLP